MRKLIGVLLIAILFNGLSIQAITSVKQASLAQELNKLDQDLSVMDQILTCLPAKANANRQAKYQIIESLKVYLTEPHIAIITGFMPSAQITQYDSRLLVRWINYQMARALGRVTVGINTDESSVDLSGLSAREMIQYNLITSPEIQATKQHLQQLIDHQNELQQHLTDGRIKPDEKIALQLIEDEITTDRNRLYYQFETTFRVILSELRALKREIGPLKKMESELNKQVKVDLRAISVEQKKLMTLLKNKAVVARMLSR